MVRFYKTFIVLNKNRTINSNFYKFINVCKNNDFYILKKFIYILNVLYSQLIN